MQEVMQYSVQYTNSGLHSRVDDTDIDTVSGESGLWVSVCCPHCLHSLECSSDEDGLGCHPGGHCLSPSSQQGHSSLPHTASTEGGCSTPGQQDADGQSG